MSTMTTIRSAANRTARRLLDLEQRVEERVPPRPRRRLTTSRHRTAVAMRRLAGGLQGAAYHLDGLRPDPDVDDELLARRVASTLGVVAHRLDLPRLHVTVQEAVVRLAGAADPASLDEVLDVARGVSGVRSVVADDVVDLDEEDRPSRVRARQRSRVHREVVGAVRALDVGDEDAAERLVGAVLSTLFDVLPDDELAHVRTHLPDDVATLTDLVPIVGHPPVARTATAFVSQVAERSGRTRDTAAQAVGAVMRALQAAVPEEADDVEAVLPRELAALWREATRR